MTRRKLNTLRSKLYRKNMRLRRRYYKLLDTLEDLDISDPFMFDVRWVYDYKPSIRAKISTLKLDISMYTKRIGILQERIRGNITSTSRE